ncbi:MAG: chemotaxis protein CheC [Methylococcaceae bacterium]|nr:MAG: chemotaxis protein CheC [Methylococcaceae bacterium]
MPLSALSDLQKDALTELFNIGVSRAAACLSEIVADEILLSAPKIELFHPSAVSVDEFMVFDGPIGSVTQRFTGGIETEVLLLFPEKQALEIIHDMLGNTVSLSEFTEFEQEAMCEIGNVILNACVATMADLLGVDFESSMPIYAIENFTTILHRAIHNPGQPLLLLLHINMIIERHQSQGYLMFLMTIPSLNALRAHLDRFLENIR